MKTGQMIRKIIVTGIVSLVLGSGCASERSSSGKFTLTYWSATGPQEVALARELTEKWNRDHPDIRVKWQPIPESQSSEEVLLAAIAGRTTPDICSVIWPGIVEQFVRAKALVRLDQFPDFQEVMSRRMSPEMLNPYRSPDGHFYQVPWKTNPIMIQYNENIFQEAGVRAPLRTYSEFWEAARKITRDTDGDGRIDRWMMDVSLDVKWWVRFFDFYTFYIAASGGKTLFSGKEVIFDNPAAVRVFQFFQKGFQEGFFPRTRFQVDPFLQGHVACHITGPWNIPYMERYKPEGFEYDFMPIPVPDGTRGPTFTYGDPKNIVIFSTTRHPEEAWAFVKYLISEEADLRLLELCHQLPIRRDLLENPRFANYFASHPLAIRFVHQIPYTRGVDPIPELREVFDTISQEFEAACIMGVKSPQQAIRDAAQRTREILME